MARQKQVSDETIIGAALHMLIVRGPSLTLAEVGDKVGLSAATVVQRFGTKQALMLEVSKLWAERAGTAPDTDGELVDRIVAFLTHLAGWAMSPANVANVTAALHTDLADPEFREVIELGFQRQQDTLSAMLQEAIDKGEMRNCEPEGLARLLQATLMGAQQCWAIQPQGRLVEWVDLCLRTCIAPWLILEGDRVAQVTTADADRR
jgi:AcrR family transcriptional regulator